MNGGRRKKITPEQRALALAKRDEMLADAQARRTDRLSRSARAAAEMPAEEPLPDQKPSPRSPEFKRWKKANVNTQG